MNKNTEYNPLKAGNAIIDGIIGTVKGFVKTFIVLAINNIIYVFFNINLNSMIPIATIILIYSIIMQIYHNDKFTFFYIIGWIICAYMFFKLGWMKYNSTLLAIIVPTIIWIGRYLFKNILNKNIEKI
jgi:hypothetical protein